jgi:hypothetical protein
MKKIILVAMSLIVLASCSKDKDVVPVPNPNNNDNNGNSNPGNVPQEAVGKWLHGTFSMSEYWGYDGTYYGNPFSQSVAFYFMSNGNYEMYYTGQTNDYGCTTDAFSYYKGYVNFTDSSFTVHPQEGNFRGYYSCNSSGNFDRPAAASELKVQTFYYTFETDTINKKWMVVRFDPSDQYPSYFAQTTW